MKTQGLEENGQPTDLGEGFGLKSAETNAAMDGLYGDKESTAGNERYNFQ